MHAYMCIDTYMYSHIYMIHTYICIYYYMYIMSNWKPIIHLTYWGTLLTLWK